MDLSSSRFGEDLTESDDHWVPMSDTIERREKHHLILKGDFKNGHYHFSSYPSNKNPRIVFPENSG